MRAFRLRDLAEELGVTTAAVSMALRNDPHVSERLRRRAQALARERHYVPSPALARLARFRIAPGKSVTAMPLALIMQPHPRSESGKFEGSREATLVKRTAEQMGYLVRAYIQDERLPPERLARILHATGIEAILLGRLYDARLLAALDWDRYSVVAWEAGCVQPPFHLVLPDLGQEIIESVRRCRERGYRRVGAVLFRETSPPVDHFDRRAGLDYCAREMTGPAFSFGVVEARPERRGDFDAWFDRFRPDAVIGQNELVYWWLRDRGVAPGRDCGFLLLHRTDEPADPKMSGFDNDLSRTARVALRLLDSEVRNFERGAPDLPQRVLLRMPWREGETLAPQSHGASRWDGVSRGRGEKRKISQ